MRSNAHDTHTVIDNASPRLYTEQEVASMTAHTLDQLLKMWGLPGRELLENMNLDNGTAQAETTINTPNTPLIITVDEMADLLDICRPTAYNLAKQEDFPSFKIGKRILVNRQGLQEWIDRQCVNSCWKKGA